MSLRSLFIKEPMAQQQNRAARRIDRIPISELPSWADQCLYAIGRNLSDYAKDPSRPEFLDEAVEGSKVLSQILERMQNRF